MLSEEVIDMVRRQSSSLTFCFRSLPEPFRPLNERLLRHELSGDVQTAKEEIMKYSEEG
jgi:hypothetical protein